MSHYLIEQLLTKSNIVVETHTTIVRVDGKERLETITTRDGRTGETRERALAAVFAFIGADADTDWLPAALERDKLGYILTGRDVSADAWPESRRPPFPLETSMPGIFAAGDVRCASVKRVASAVGEGSMVVAYVHQYLETRTIVSRVG
jgi:thioredoxin reductase (NADPH)